MDHATMFSYRHSLNGREAAAHLRGWTSEHYTSSAQLNRETYTVRSSAKRSIVISGLFPSVPTVYSHLYRQLETLHIGLTLEDEEENCVYS